MDHLEEAKYFSTFDVVSGFHQIPLAPESKPKTAFSVPREHYQYTRLPMGISNRSPAFQRRMDIVLSGLQSIALFVYKDDIVVYGRDLEDHTAKYKMFVGRIHKVHISLQPSKCDFLKKEATFVEQCVSQEKLKPNPKTVAPGIKSPPPWNQK